MLFSIKLFIQYCMAHPTRFSCWIHLSVVSSNIWLFIIALSAKHYAVECILNVFIDIRMSIICGVPQKIKGGEGHKQDKREEVKMVSDSENERGPIKVGETFQTHLTEKKGKRKNKKRIQIQKKTGSIFLLSSVVIFLIGVHQLIQH